MNALYFICILDIPNSLYIVNWLRDYSVSYSPPTVPTGFILAVCSSRQAFSTKPSLRRGTDPISIRLIPLSDSLDVMFIISVMHSLMLHFILSVLTRVYLFCIICVTFLHYMLL